MKAVWNGKVIAESDDTVVVENSHYFPAGSVKKEYLEKSGNQYQCSWKGLADYYRVKVDKAACEDCAFVYPEPSAPAKQIKGHFAFWKGVEVTE